MIRYNQKLNKAKKLGIIIIGFILAVSCNNRDTKVVYVDSMPPIDSNTVFRITYKDGKVTDTYVNKKFFNNSIVAGNLSLNDSSFYVFDDINGIQKKSSVFKYAYKKDFFTVTINNDTIVLGDTLKGSVYYYSNDFKVHLKDEARYIKSINHLSDGQSIEFSWKANKPGLSSFEGYLDSREDKIPFTYNYVVVSSDGN